VVGACPWTWTGVGAADRRGRRRGRRRCRTLPSHCHLERNEGIRLRIASRSRKIPGLFAATRAPKGNFHAGPRQARFQQRTPCRFFAWCWSCGGPFGRLRAGSRLRRIICKRTIPARGDRFEEEACTNKTPCVLAQPAGGGSVLAGNWGGRNLW
jgi:hypothetical protein